MKTSKYIFKIGLVGLLAMGSCKFDEDINKDPVNPTDAPMSSILTTSEVGIGYTVGGNIARYNGMFVQHLAGIDRQALTIGRYNIGQQDTDDPWDNMYRFMNQLKVVIRKADEQQSPKYKGVAQILLAYSLGTVTDQWGDVPFSEAFKGDPSGSGLRPKYDKQQALYDTIQVLLSQGIRNCKLASALSPGPDDIIYNGSMSKWISLSYALKARYSLHLSKKDGNAYSKALLFADSAGVVSPATIKFSGTTSQNEGPMFQYNDQRGDIVVASTLVNYFKRTSDSLKQFSGDPRLLAAVDVPYDSLWSEVTLKEDGETDTLYRVFLPYGAQPGEQDFGTSYGAGEVEVSALYMGPFLGAPNSDVPLFLPSELYFIKAEAHLALGQSTEAATAHNSAVESSLDEMGVATDDDFIAEYGSETSETITLERIMNQKWVALYCNAEAWTDWRRTGFPVLDAASSNSLDGKIPVRYPYPQKERTLNGGNVPDEGSKPALKPVWWNE